MLDSRCVILAMALLRLAQRFVVTSRVSERMAGCRKQSIWPYKSPTRTLAPFGADQPRLRRSHKIAPFRHSWPRFARLAGGWRCWPSRRSVGPRKQEIPRGRSRACMTSGSARLPPPCRSISLSTPSTEPTRHCCNHPLRRPRICKSGGSPKARRGSGRPWSEHRPRKACGSNRRKADRSPEPADGPLPRPPRWLGSRPLDGDADSSRRQRSNTRRD